MNDNCTEYETGENCEESSNTYNDKIQQTEKISSLLHTNNIQSYDILKEILFSPDYYGLK